VCSALSRGAFALFVETSSLASGQSQSRKGAHRRRSFGAPVVETSSVTIDAVAALSRTLAVPLVTPAGPSDTPALDPHRRRTALPGHDAAAAPVHAPPGSGADRSGYVVFMRPPYHQVLADVIIHYSWTRVFYAYDNAEGRLRVRPHTHRE